MAVGLELLRAGKQDTQLGARKLFTGQKMASHRGIVDTEPKGSFAALTWNLFHGRDFPPDPALFTWRSRLLRRTERNATHVQVNRPLLDPFANALDAMDWQVALLQEAPPRWLRLLGERCGCSGVLARTSRNELPALRAAAAQLNPDLIASNEGGSNMVLVRAPGRLEQVERVPLAVRPERRTLLLARVSLPCGSPLAVACMHLSVNSTGQGPAEVERAATMASRFAGGAPLLFGGDLNLRPRQHPNTFTRLRDSFGLQASTRPEAIDHLLTAGLGTLSRPRALEPSDRELVAEPGRRLRLSDHAPIVGRFEMR